MVDDWTMTLSKKSLPVLGSLDNYSQSHRLNPTMTTVPIVTGCVKRHEVDHDHLYVGGKTIPGKRKKRTTPPLSVEQLRLLSRRIDPIEPSKPALPILYKPSPRKRLRVQPDNTEIPPAIMSPPPSLSKMMEDQDGYCSDTITTLSHSTTTTTTLSSSFPSPLLYQTCFDIWPGEPSLGDLAHDKVKNLSQLLKVRLSQAKFRVIAALEAQGQGGTDNTLYRQLKSSEDECSIWPAGFIGKKHKIRLSNKCHQAPWGVTVGNGRHLNIKKEGRVRTKKTALVPLHSLTSPSTSKTSMASPLSSSSNQQQQTRDASRKSKCAKWIDPDLVAVTLQDGSRAFICKDCKKKYKNRNGLVYHRDRCKQRKPIKPINCACGEKHAHDPLVQCETCHLYSHLECIGLDENELNNEGAFHCPTCILVPTDKPYTDLSSTTVMQGQSHQIWEDFSMSPSSSMSNNTWTSSTTPSLTSSSSSLGYHDVGLMTPSSNHTMMMMNTPSPSISSQQSDSQWFEFANFDTDFTFQDSQNE
ncbi:hypothetical protein BDA99DRAFT_500311 [Phascolomyces articulosus]|uniref:C2H2-type domain-containing protein n=1 Tax=Phascolomyces articulosus TaxID=60185 RepID=A0AAD5KMK8_9FUNG|nr:hypothetical protein BDA99DRAFT_500311 [Phascolomyces articulosus]